MKIRQKSSAALFLAVLVAAHGPVKGQAPSDGRASDRFWRGDASVQAAQPKQREDRGRKTLSGIIQQASRLTLRNPNGQVETHWVARIELPNGAHALADLGKVRQPSMFIPTIGMRVELRGILGRINGREVLFADTASRAGRSFQILRHAKRS